MTRSAPGTDVPASASELPEPPRAIVEAVASSPGIGRQLEGLTRRKKGTVFAHVARTAQPFLTALILQRAKLPGGNVWVLCDTEREQERFHAELTTWLPDALLFPHLEIAVVEGAIPDAEIAAERLAVLRRVAARDEPAVVVINRHSFDEAVYPADALRETSVTLDRGMPMDRDALIAKLVGAGYTSAAQVAQRGEYSVRGGVLDVYSWQHVSRLCAPNGSTTRSSPCASSTWTSKPRCARWTKLTCSWARRKRKAAICVTTGRRRTWSSASMFPTRRRGCSSARHPASARRREAKITRTPSILRRWISTRSS